MINCTTCERFDGHKCLEFGYLIGMAICPYAVEKKPSNNYEMIQAMSMEELAFELAISGCPKIYLLDESSEVFNCSAEEDPTRGDCVKCWLDWLKQKAEDGEK